MLRKLMFRIRLAYLDFRDRQQRRDFRQGDGFEWWGPTDPEVGSLPSQFSSLNDD